MKVICRVNLYGDHISHDICQDLGSVYEQQWKLFTLPLIYLINIKCYNAIHGFNQWNF